MFPACVPGFEYKIYPSCLGAIPSDLFEREVLQLSLSDKLDFKVLISLGHDAAKARKSIRWNAELERVWNASRNYNLQTGVPIRQASHSAINYGTPAVECDLPSLEYPAANIESCGLSRYPSKANERVWRPGRIVFLTSPALSEYPSKLALGSIHN